MKYIDAEKLIALIDSKLEDLGMSGSVWVGRSVLQELKNDIITSLQQEQLKVDLKKEYKEFVEDDMVYSKLVNGIVGEAIAKHFFELGLKAKQD